MSVADFDQISMIVTHDEDKFKMIRNIIRMVNLRSEPRPSRPIPHFTPKTHDLLERLRKQIPIDSTIRN